MSSIGTMKKYEYRSNSDDRLNNLFQLMPNKYMLEKNYSTGRERANIALQVFKWK